MTETEKHVHVSEVHPGPGSEKALDDFCADEVHQHVGEPVELTEEETL